MKNKIILFTSPNVAEIVESDMPKLENDEVLVKLVRSTISAGTERANLTGDPNVNSNKAPSVSFPRRGGYSSSGVIVSVGSDVTKHKVGDRVSCAWGYHGQYCKFKEHRVFAMDDGIGFDEGALVNIATFPLAAIRKCRLEIGESTLIMGLGVLGLIAIQLAKVAGAAPIIAVDPVESKRARALELGADYALDPFADGFADTVKELTGGGAKVCIEITGNGKGLDMALDCMARFGRVALLGCTRNSDFTIDYYRKVHGPGISLIGAHIQAKPQSESFGGWWCERDEELTVLRLLSLGRLDFKTLIEEVHPYAEAPKLYTRLATDRSFPVVQFDWEAEE